MQISLTFELPEPECGGGSWPTSRLPDSTVYSGPNFTHLKTSVHRFIRLFTSLHHCTKLYILVHASTILYMLVHTFTRLYTRGTRYCWAWHKHSFETNKLTMFLETEAAFSYCNWSIKMARIIWFGSTSVDIGPAYLNNWRRLGHHRMPLYFIPVSVTVRLARTLLKRLLS